MKLPEYKLELIPVDERATDFRKFSGHCWKDLGNRFKIGGDPEFITDNAWPICQLCQSKMTFYAQLDTVSEKIDIADSGLIYIFYCFNCNKVKALVQSY